MSDKPKRRWFQFSLRMLLATVTLVAIGMAWWKHRGFCMEQGRLHAERNADCAREILGESKERREGHGSWTDFPELCLKAEFNNSGEASYSYTLQSIQTNTGHYIFSLSVDSGKLPDPEQRLCTEMTREAELTGQYFHAIWRPWERLWIEESR